MKTNKVLRNIQFQDLIIFEDDSYVIINKPPFVSTLADRASETNILDLAKSYHPDSQVCHRLDKDTSGLLVIAKDNDAYKYFSSLLENREVQKLYHAIVSGRHEIDEEIEAPIFTTSNRSRVDNIQGKPSITLVKTLHIYKKHTLLACMPFTGRMHQIRVHLSFLELPICGDSMYGGRPIYLSEVKKNFKIGKFEEERPLMQRMALHAEGLNFLGLNGKKIKLHAPHPKDFEVTLKQLKKND